MNVGDHTLELLKRFHSEFTDFRREQLSQGLRLATIEQHLAANQIEIARLSGDMAHVKEDIGTIKRRLDLVDA
jgi:TolA-binding protein